MVLTNTPLDETFGIFIDPWTDANDLAVWTTTLTTIKWQANDKPTRAMDYGSKSQLLVELFGSLIQMLRIKVIL